MLRLDIRVGDKVQVMRSGAKVRGVVEHLSGAVVRMRAEDGTLLVSTVAKVRNFSDAARRAWEKMPERKVGRPRGSTKAKRVSVTLRFDQSLWSRFLFLEEQGLVADRGTLFNRFLAKITEGKEKACQVAGTPRKGKQS